MWQMPNNYRILIDIFVQKNYPKYKTHISKIFLSFLTFSAIPIIPIATLWAIFNLSVVRRKIKDFTPFQQRFPIKSI